MWKALVKIFERKACNHDWEVIHEKFYEDQVPQTKWGEGRKAHTRILLKCKKCGKLETVII